MNCFTFYSFDAAYFSHFWCTEWCNVVRSFIAYRFPSIVLWIVNDLTLLVFIIIYYSKRSANFKHNFMTELWHVPSIIQTICFSVSIMTSLICQRHHIIHTTMSFVFGFVMQNMWPFLIYWHYNALQSLNMLWNTALQFAFWVKWHSFHRQCALWSWEKYARLKF